MFFDAGSLATYRLLIKYLAFDRYRSPKEWECGD